MTYELTLENFRGPLDKLLELIETRKLQVTEISLAQVTNDFLAYLKTLETVETPLLADFIVVASRLILIKSRSLLPDFEVTEEEEREIKDLERRLLLYRELRPTQRFLTKLWREGNVSYARPYLFVRPYLPQKGIETPKVFYPGSRITLDALLGSLGRIFEDFQKFELETRTIEEKIVRIEEKIQEVVDRLNAKGAMTFSDLSQAKSRSEIIVIFLAILHLAREQLVSLEQQHYFSDIMIRSPKENT